MTEHEYQMKLTNIEPTEWIKLNAGTSGFYRMHYSKDMLDSLLQPFSAQQISVADRFGLVSDMFALIQSGHMLASEFLRLLKYCCEENEYTVWSAIDGQPTTLEMPSSGLHKLASLMEHHPDSAIKDLYNGYISSVSSPLKSLVFNQLAKSGHKLIIDMALQLFDHHAEEAILLASDLRAVVFGCVARQNDLKKMGSLMRIYTTCDSVDIQRECLQAIGQCSDKDLLASIYKYLVEEGHCKSQDIVHLFFGSQTSKTGQEFSWEYFKCNYRMLIKKFGCLNNSFKQVMKTCASSLFFSNAAQDVENFCKSNFDRNQLMDLESTINEITDSLWVNQKLVNTHFHDIAQFLSREAS
uniref:ERAP1-like C-terminal domain-containing protein n=1 Tax=Ditylenchus dipsaci TaxID=166011 RepID=A0A915DAT7_9BILA